MSPAIESRYARLWCKRPKLVCLGDRTIGGVVLEFEKRSQPTAIGHVEVIAPEFLHKSQADGWPGVTSHFDGMTLIGSTYAGTLRVAADDHAVSIEADVPRSLPHVNEYVERNDVADVALTWQVFEDCWEWNDGGFPMRILLSGKLIAVNPTASMETDFINTSAALRSLAAFTSESVEAVRDLSTRKELRRLWGWEPQQREQRDPVYFGKWGRDAHVENVEAQAGGAPILDVFAVAARPGGTP